MSIKQRALIGALAFFGGLLVMLGASLTKTNAQITYEMDLEKKRPDPRVPENGVANVFLGIGVLLTVAGPFLIVSAWRDMSRQIGEAQSSAEMRMRLAVEEKRDPKPKG
jgi:hypothetical protein